MRHAASRQLHAYWHALRGGRPAPCRDDIDPAAIRGILASVFTLGVAAGARPDGAAFRVSGTRLDALLGRALRGSTFGGIWTERSVPLAAAALHAVLDGRRPVVAAVGGAPPAREPVEMELLMLPLAGGPDGRRQVLGCLAAFSAPGWMGLSPVSALEMLPARAPQPGAGPGAVLNRGGRGARPFALHRGGRGAPPPASLRP